MERTEEDIVDDLVGRIARGGPESSVFSEVGMLLEKYRLHRDGTVVSSGEDMGWTEFVDPVHLSDAGVRRIAHALVLYVEMNLEGHAVGSAVSVLGILRDPSLHDLFCRVLRHHVDRDAHVLHQALVALDRIGADLGWGPSRSTLAESENRGIARGYLTRGPCADD